MFVEIFLQLLIRKIDVELFKPVNGKVLKAKDIQNTHKCKLVLPATNSDVNLFQNPAEEVGIETHGGGISGVFSLDTQEY